MGRAESPSIHSKAEILPPIEGLSSSRRFPAPSVTLVADVIFLTLRFQADSRGGNFLGDKKQN
jgi:hypothetical protein